MKVLTYVEIDVDYCSLFYGVSPCAAELGVTGSKLCFNTLATCQDRVNFDNAPVTLRFALPTNYLPPSIEATPNVRKIDFNSGTVSLGKDLGTRSSITIEFEDHPHADTGLGFDKYVTERPYNPSKQGTFWGKFRARQPYLRGRRLRLITGVLGQALSEMETHHFIIESFDGPTLDGTYVIIAQDVLKLADGDRAKAPLLNSGFLAAPISSGGGTLTLSPAGVGNAEYETSGFVALGGKEICAFTRSGDTLTLTARGQLGTAADSHSANDRVQQVLAYIGEDPADIIYDLLVNYAGVDPAFIPLSAWQLETGTYLQRVYTGYVAEPTPVKNLLSEIIEQAALALWWDDKARLLRLQVLRGIDTSAATFTERSINEFESEEQPDTRISQVHTYFAQRNPLETQDDPNNYRSVERTVDPNEADYGSSNIKVIYSRWIPLGGRTTAQRLNNLQLGRFVIPPRRFNFRLARGNDSGVALGSGYQLAVPNMQTDTGERGTAPIQVVRLKPNADWIEIEAEEARFQHFDADDLTNRVIIIDTSTLNFNLRAAHDQIFPAITADQIGYVTLICVIQPGVMVGSALTSLPAFHVGSWPSGFDIVLRVLGRIQGRGGDGAPGGFFTGNPGLAGGAALYTRVAIELETDTGEIWGGGGGGAGTGAFAGGGGGAGYQPGNGGGGGNGQPGTTEAGGPGGVVSSGSGSVVGPSGGGPGLAGGASGSTPGGAAGAAIDGISFVTITAGPGDRRGSEVN